MANTTNFGWETPDDTDLVKDGAAAMRTLGNSIDASFIDLKGGTTGQVLSKASNTDLDFSWSSVDPLTILDAKGDLISATAADTPARLAVGANGTVLTADSTESTGLKWATPASGSMTLLETISFAGASSYTSNTLSSSYKNLYIVVRDYDPSTDNTGLNMRVNGISSTSYTHATGFLLTSAFNQTSAEISANLDNTVNDGLDIIEIADYANTTTIKVIESKSIGFDATTPTSIKWRYSFSPVNTTSAISTVTFLASSGNLNGGTAFIYGVN